MNHQSQTAQLDLLHGMVLGLQAAVRGLIATHPDPERAIEHVHLCLEDMQASGLASAGASDVVLHGLARSEGFVLPTQLQLDRAAAHRTRPQG